MSSLSFTHMPLLTHGQTIQQHILEICQPFFEAYGITLFAHARAFKDGSVAVLVSNMAIADYWIQRQYPLGVFTEPGCYLGIELGDLHSQQQQKDLREQFGIDHSVYIINRYAHYADIFMLATRPENRQIIHTYLTHMESIKRFLRYYEDKCHRLIQLAEKHKLVSPLSKLDRPAIITPTALSFSQNLKPQRYFINEEIGFITLTAQQRACLSRLVQGQSLKEISVALNLSARTVETYIEHIKYKFKCSKVSQLAYLVGKANIDIDQY